jgi:hypothetical protein
MKYISLIPAQARIQSGEMTAKTQRRKEGRKGGCAAFIAARGGLPFSLRVSLRLCAFAVNSAVTS